ncbi:hypothetical protein T10_10133 [Trichinella papuae]|uniref:DDE-1 domain-containing protein n=1 Tax=Trichinella papuae TaxID=268474 RepID=A0A0V1MH41_9BILA|nr:hypothetical protein T10_10133 [Trichinella papuae]
MLLIIDNAPCHPSCELLDRENGLFKKELLRRIVLSEADAGNLVSKRRNVHLKDCCYMTEQAWNSISGSTLWYYGINFFVTIKNV